MKWFLIVVGNVAVLMGQWMPLWAQGNGTNLAPQMPQTVVYQDQSYRLTSQLLPLDPAKEGCLGYLAVLWKADEEESSRYHKSLLAVLNPSGQVIQGEEGGWLTLEREDNPPGRPVYLVTADHMTMGDGRSWDLMEVVGGKPRWLTARYNRQEGLVTIGGGGENRFQFERLRGGGLVLHVLHLSNGLAIYKSYIQKKDEWVLLTRVQSEINGMFDRDIQTGDISCFPREAPQIAGGPGKKRWFSEEGRYSIDVPPAPRDYDHGPGGDICYEDVFYYDLDPQTQLGPGSFLPGALRKVSETFPLIDGDKPPELKITQYHGFSSIEGAFNFQYPLINGFPGETVEVPVFRAFVRLVLVNHRLYQLTYTALQKDFKQSDPESYFNTLEFQHPQLDTGGEPCLCDPFRAAKP